MKLLVFVATLFVGVAVACSSVDRPSEPAVTVPLSGPQGLPKVILADTLSPTSAAKPESIIAAFSFAHDGFRTQVNGESGVAAVPEQPGGSTVTVYIRNLSSSSGSMNSRATINFSRDFDNYVEIPTSAGQMRLHLHRDGALRTGPDNGAFT